MTAAVLNTKISEVKNKIPFANDFVKKTHYDVLYFSTSYHNKFTSDILDAKIEQKELAHKSDISCFVKILT